MGKGNICIIEMSHSMILLHHITVFHIYIAYLPKMQMISVAVHILDTNTRSSWGKGVTRGLERQLGYIFLIICFLPPYCPWHHLFVDLLRFINYGSIQLLLLNLLSLSNEFEPFFVTQRMNFFSTKFSV